MQARPARIAARIEARCPGPATAWRRRRAIARAAIRRAAADLLAERRHRGRPGPGAARRACERCGALHDLRAGRGRRWACCRRVATRTGFAVTAMRADSAARATSQVAAIGAHGETLSDAHARISSAATIARQAHIALPLEVRNADRAAGDRTARTAAGAVQLLDAAARSAASASCRPAATENEQPLLSDVYYLERALSPYRRSAQGHDQRTARAACLGADPGRYRQDRRQRCRRGGEIRRAAAAC